MSLEKKNKTTLHFFPDISLILECQDWHTLD